ncbi:Alpha-ketoglutarate-dependent dioxygenase FTO [Frankliniella fusca]|uniref:Alpha-ketoglutarate-dependent dioxygenase FTO n=1 Tax=Frankliniella fusca TaxID=407009 RepID=A0AAE1HNQ5_9NEOP|nr:Alpha-ketoglutarate-dependent dioxygenase FTO [Frankliniella fusca]
MCFESWKSRRMKGALGCVRIHGEPLHLHWGTLFGANRRSVVAQLNEIGSLDVCKTGHGQGMAMARIAHRLAMARIGHRQAMAMVIAGATATCTKGKYEAFKLSYGPWPHHGHMAMTTLWLSLPWPSSAHGDATTMAMVWPWARTMATVCPLCGYGHGHGPRMATDRFTMASRMSMVIEQVAMSEIAERSSPAADAVAVAVQGDRARLSRGCTDGQTQQTVRDRPVAAGTALNDYGEV